MFAKKKDLWSTFGHCTFEGLKSKLVEMAKKEMPSCFHANLSKLRPHSPRAHICHKYHKLYLWRKVTIMRSALTPSWAPFLSFSPPPPVFSTSTTLLTTVLLAEETSESALLSSESAHSQVGNMGRTYKSTFCFVEKRIMLSCKARVVKRCRQQSQTFHIWWLLQKILRLSGGLSPPTTLPWPPCPNRFYKRDIVCTCLWAIPDAKRSKMNIRKSWVVTREMERGLSTLKEKDDVKYEERSTQHEKNKSKPTLKIALIQKEGNNCVYVHM